jgi:hypothetical protein
MSIKRFGEFPDRVSKVLEELVSENETVSVWLIGSRANGAVREDSDWDFVAFVSDLIFERPARNHDVDIIRVDRDGTYLLEGQSIARAGPFKTWRWRRNGPNQALYTVRVPPDVHGQSSYDLEQVEFRALHATKVWSRDA